MNDTSHSVFPSAHPDHWNNLLWALTADDISCLPALPWLPRARREELARFFAVPATRAALEDDLLATVDSERSRRLGVYFENLWAFVFAHHPQYQLIARNLPLRAEGKTLGELDVVVRYLPDGVTEHWEIAVKFYLQVGHYWVGPGLKDRLDIKLAHTRDHQLPVIHQPAAHHLLQQQGIDIERQWTVMPGRRFRPLAESSADAPWWADRHTFLDGFADQDWEWLQLPKQCWLAPCSPTPVDSHIDSRIDSQPNHRRIIGNLPPELFARGPLCVAAMRGQKEVSRGFIVADDWQVRALAQLPAAET